MARITSVDVTSGIPTAGTGTVATLDGVLDATNGPAAIKPASTAPLPTDKALVVAISPNSVNANGRATAANSAPVTLPSDAAASSSVTFTPAASSHTAGDCVGAAGNFASLGASGSSIMITSATLYIDNTAALATAWRLHLYNVTPSSAIADDSAWDFADADVTQYLGYIDLPSTATDIGTNQWAQADGINKQVKMAGTGLFGYLQNLSTVTTTATAHIVTLNTVQL